jgi:hypothetical protein
MPVIQARSLRSWSLTITGTSALCGNPVGGPGELAHGAGARGRIVRSGMLRRPYSPATRTHIAVHARGQQNRRNALRDCRGSRTACHRSSWVSDARSGVSGGTVRSVSGRGAERFGMDPAVVLDQDFGEAGGPAGPDRNLTSLARGAGRCSPASAGGRSQPWRRSRGISSRSWRHERCPPQPAEPVHAGSRRTPPG